MITSKCFELIYDGAGKHYLQNLAKYSIGSPISYQLAEFVLDKIAFADGSKIDRSIALGKQNIESYFQKQKDPIRHIHQSCKDEIMSKWAKPMLTEEEVDEILYQEILEDNLQEIAREYQATLELRF